MTSYSFSQVDVFAPEPLCGNPVAVVHDANGLTDRQMADFARWTNGLRGSMGRVGACGDNAAMESFFAPLQKNVLTEKRWVTRTNSASRS